VKDCFIPQDEQYKTNYRFRKRRLFFSALILLATLVPAAAQIDQAPKVIARLVADRLAVSPRRHADGGAGREHPSRLAHLLVNPGDAGAPTEIKWTLPPDWTADAIQWPYPERDPVGR